MSKTSDQTLSLDTFSPEAKSLVARAQKFADDNKCKFFDPAHLLAVLLDVSDVVQALKDHEINTVLFTNQLHRYLGQLSTGETTSSLAPTTIELFNRTANNVGAKRQVNVFDLFYAVVQEATGIVGKLCKQFNITPDLINLDKGKERNNSPYFINLSTLASDVIIGRDDEVRRLIQILGRRSKHHPIMVGEHGVGKRTIVLALTDRIKTKSVPKNLIDATVIQLNTTNLLSGVKSRTDVEKRLREALKSLTGKTIVYIRSIDALMVQGLNLNIQDLFEMFWDNGIQVITATTPDGLKKLIEKEANLVKELTQLVVEPCSIECAVEVLRGIASRYEQYHGIKIGEAAINTAVKLAKRYVQDRCLPESAIDLIDESASNKMSEMTGVPIKFDKVMSRLSSLKAQLSGLSGNKDDASVKAIAGLEKEAQSLNYQLEAMSHPRSVEKEAVLSEENIAVVLEQWTGVPCSKFLEGETERLAKMEEKLRGRVIGQDDALKAISKAVRRSYLGLRDVGKPIGSFLLLGSSGVGKTEIAKSLAEFLFNDESAMCRIDCSELMSSHQSQKLIGATVGYEGSQDGGVLTEFVRKKPYCVILFDEVEKAHGDVWNLCLQLLDDGRLTDGRGRTTDFSNTIILMTSNIGSKKILNADPSVFASEEGFAALKAMLQKEMTDYLRPELINRLNETIICRALGHEQLFGILDIQLRNLNKMLVEREITVKLSDDAKKELVRISYEPAYGARPLKRAITKYVQDPIVEALMNGSYPKGSTVNVLFSSDSFILET